MGRRGALAASVLALGALLSGCSAPGGVVENRDYARLAQPQQVDTAGIEVVEFFWYGCPHCADMHPRLRAWAASQPADVRLRYEPVSLSAKWEGGAQLHFTLAALDALDREAGNVYTAVQLDGLDLQDEAAVLAWAQSAGLDRTRFGQTWRSPAVAQQVARSRELAARYQIKGVPTLVVDGKYLTSNAFTGSSGDTLKAVDALVLKVRAERAGGR